MATIEDRLALLKVTIHEKEPPDIVSQCAVVSKALEPWQSYMENGEGLAMYLGVSPDKVYQMDYIHKNMVAEAKKWFKESKYGCHTAFLVSRMSADEQKMWIKEKSFKA